MKHKRIFAGLLCAALLILACPPLPAQAAEENGETRTVGGVDFSADAELRNHQQSDRPWGSYTVQGSQNSIAAAGCGILAVCNALQYATGYFPDPAQLAEWANRNNAGYNGDWTEGTVLFARFADTFGEALGFHTVVYDDREGNQNLPRVRTFINELDAKDTLIGFVRDGAAMAAYVENHFVAIVDYNSMTDRFLVWDNNAGDKNGGRRAGITHAAGDWFTWEDMRGTLKNAAGTEFQFCIEYAVPLLPTQGRQTHHVSRDGLTVGNLMLQRPGECCNFTPVNVKPYAGQTLVFSGSYTARGEIDAVGYRVNGGKTVLVPDAAEPASDDALEKGRVWCGADARTVGFRVPVPVGASDKRYDIVISEGGVERIVWTAVVTTQNTGEPLIIGETETENGTVTGGETVPETAAETAAGTAAESLAEPDSFAETAAQSDAADTEPADKGRAVAAGIIAAVCFAAVVILCISLRTHKLPLLLASAAVLVCAAVAVILLLCVGRTDREPEETGPAVSAEAGTLPEETGTDGIPSAGQDETAGTEPATSPAAETTALPTAEEERQCLRTAAVGDIVFFGVYEQDNDPDNGKEPVGWRVLAREEDKVLVISDKGLDCQPYNEIFWSTTWERSTLRSWLNRTFLGEAFSGDEQAMIVKTKVPADANPDYTTTPGGGTSDKVFLLSAAEAERYLPSSKDRKCVPTAYAIARGAWTTELIRTTDSPACCWWLRTPGSTVFDAAYVHYRGSIVTGGRRVMSVSTVCVRPAMWIKLPTE